MLNRDRVESPEILYRFHRASVDYLPRNWSTCTRCKPKNKFQNTTDVARQAVATLCCLAGSLAAIAEAESMGRRAVTLSEKAYGPDHRSSLSGDGGSGSGTKAQQFGPRLESFFQMLGTRSLAESMT
jgi:hypothetical protein